MDRLRRNGDRFLATAGGAEIEADNVVVAMSGLPTTKDPRVRLGAGPEDIQVHVVDYRNPGQLGAGDVLVVGVGNSGAEIAMELVRERHVWLSGPSTGQMPFRPEAMSGRILMPLAKPVMTRVLSTSTPIGRKARPKFLSKGSPLLRVKSKDLVRAGVERVGRTVGIRDGYPELEDGQVVDVGNVVWCTGFDPGFSWIDLPVFDRDGGVRHNRGVVDGVPGLYFVGLKFLHSALSDTLATVGGDAGYVVDRIVERPPVRTLA